MKCPNCGSEGGPSGAPCISCGRPLPRLPKIYKPTTGPDKTAEPHQGTASPSAGHVIKFTHRDVAKKLKFDYMYGSKDHLDKVLVSLDSVLIACRRPKMKQNELLSEIANVIYKQLRIREVSIGLKDPKDGLYRYSVMAGMIASKWRAHENLVYTRDDFFRNDKWNGTMISKYTKLMLAEDNPYEAGEEDTVDWHEMQSSKRHNLDDSIEGDYLDIMIHGQNDELVGWIEISGSWTSKLPDPQTIRIIELIAGVLGMVLSPNENLKTNGK